MSSATVHSGQFKLNAAIEKLTDVSDDGNFLHVTRATHEQTLLDFRTEKECKAMADWLPLLAPEVVKRINRAPRVMLQAARVAISNTGNIYFSLPLVSKFFLEISLNLKKQLGLLDHKEESDFNRRTGSVAFEPVEGPKGVRNKLTAARFLDGSRIFFDSRGLFHLKSSDPSRPEIALVLHQPHLAGWSSDGKCCGDPYFLDPNRKDLSLVSDEIFYKMILKFTERLR